MKNWTLATIASPRTGTSPHLYGDLNPPRRERLSHLIKTITRATRVRNPRNSPFLSQLLLSSRPWALVKRLPSPRLQWEGTLLRNWPLAGLLRVLAPPRLAVQARTSLKERGITLTLSQTRGLPSLLPRPWWSSPSLTTSCLLLKPNPPFSTRRLPLSLPNSPKSLLPPDPL